MEINAISTIDAFCHNIMMEHIKGRISHEEAEEQMQEHGDEIITDTLNSGFKLKYVIKS